MSGKAAKPKRGNGEGEYTTLNNGKVGWRVRVIYPDGSTSRPSGTAENKTAARQAVEKAKSEAEAGRRPLARTLTVSEMVLEYMGAKRATWADRTYWNNEKLYLRHIRPHLGEKRAAGIQPKDLRAYFEKLTAGGLDAASGQRQIHVLLSGAYKRAIGDGLLRDNPTMHARPVRMARRVAKMKAFGVNPPNRTTRQGTSPASTSTLIAPRRSRHARTESQPGIQT